jgi:hypothetical protein
LKFSPRDSARERTRKFRDNFWLLIVYFPEIYYQNVQTEGLADGQKWRWQDQHALNYLR